MAAATDYAKKKNADLEELLKARGLPHTGKKAELVARLQEDDAAKAAAGGEDVIDWDDAGEGAGAADAGAASSDAAAAAAQATSKPAADAIAAGGEGRVANPVAVPNQVQGEDPAKEDLTVKQPEPVKDYSAGLASTSLTDELERRKARAARFGLADETAAVDKELQRAKRFGVEAAAEESSAPAVGGLDAALPDETRRKRGRGPEVHGGRDGKRRDSRRRDDRGGERVREGGVKKGQSGGGARGPMTDGDRLKAEARAKRFAAAT